MSEQHLVDACLRIVSNRCRNLRKTIDRAKSWQQVAESGTELNEEQLESIRSVPRKEALLAELQEILRKQTLAVTSSTSPSSGSDPGTKSMSGLSPATEASEASKITHSGVNDDEGLTQTTQSGDDLPAESIDNQTKSTLHTEEPAVEDHKSRSSSQNELIESAPSVTNPSAFPLPYSGPELIGAVDIGPPIGQSSVLASSQGSLPSPAVLALNEGAKTISESQQEVVPSSSSVSALPSHPLSSANVPHSLSDPYSEKVSLLVQEIESRHAIQLQNTKDDCVRRILNFFHVADFLHQSGSREALLCYFNTAEGRQQPRRVSGLDMDLIVYFNVMLTSPNGSVPHDDAVDVSTAHCLEFLKRSNSEAFKGTSYATLVDVVNAISTCPILTERGKCQTTASKTPASLIEKSVGSANGHASSTVGSSVSAS